MRFAPFSRAFMQNVETGEVCLAFRTPPRAWSADALDLYDRRMAEAADLTSAGSRYDTVVLYKNAVGDLCWPWLVAMEGDPRPGRSWRHGTREAAELLAAFLPISSDHRPGAPDPRR